MKEGGIKKVAVLLEHHGGDEFWTATVPQAQGVTAEGKTEEEATKSVASELQAVVDEYPDVADGLSEEVKFLITEVDVRLPD